MKVSPKVVWILLGLAVSALALSSKPSWGGNEPKKPSPKSANGPQPVTTPQLDSATDILQVDDMEKFRVGYPMNDVLKDIHWAGTFEMAAEVRGKSVAAISYFVCYNRCHETLWAIFVDDKFTGFIERPEFETPIQVGTFDPLHRAVEQKPIVFKEYKQKVVEFDVRFAKHDNPFLTKLAEKMGPETVAAEKRFEEPNTKLRDQFNAARLKLGMTRAKVAEVLKAKPLDSGSIGADTFEIYGSTKNFSIWSSQHYSNIVTLYRGDRLTGIYSGYLAPGGKYGFDCLRKPSGEDPPRFKGLPPATVKLD